MTSTETQNGGVTSDVPLFTDGLPEQNHDGGFSGRVAAKIAGISYRQLDYWTRTGIVQSGVQSAAGSGTHRLYGFRDILVLKLIKRLLDTGISLQQIRIAFEQLNEAGISDLAKATLMSDGVGVYLCTSHDEVIDLLSQGQGVFGIAVGKVLHEVEASLVDLEAHKTAPETKTVSVAGDELAAWRARKAS